MNFSFRRLRRIIIKEFKQTLRDKKMLGFIFVAPIFQLFLFGYAITSDVTNIATAMCDYDKTASSRALIQKFDSSKEFKIVDYVANNHQVEEALQSGHAKMVLVIPKGFAVDVATGKQAQIAAFIDGSDSQTARVIGGYTTGVLREFSRAKIELMLNKAKQYAPRLPQINYQPRVWYNPEMKSVRFMVPGVLAMIIMMISMILTSMGIVKEREIGTLEQLIVTPITPLELMLGKTLPYLVIALIDLCIILIVARIGFDLPVRGSILIIVFSAILFLMTTLGLGIFISTISTTQQEAMLTAFFFIMPFILLSGFIFPIENMPTIFQNITLFIPMRYFLEIVRGVFLKGTGFPELWPQMLTLLTFGITIITASALRFRKRLG
jgi:ABC-2 type transport system permease protein